MDTGSALFPSFTRPMKPDEIGQVDALLAQAFGGGEEVALVAKLRKSRAMAGEMVLPLGREVIGYYALAQMVAPKGWVCLAPVAVAPQWQRKKHGKRMIAQLVAWAGQTRQPVVVLGQPEFYERAGFVRADASRLSGPYPMENTLLAGIAETPEARLVYPQAFAGL
jgi:putative acetyltransferase